MISGGGFFSRNKAGSDLAAERNSNSSSETYACRLFFLRCSSRVVFPTCREPVSRMTGESRLSERIKCSSRLFLYMLAILYYYYKLVKGTYCLLSSFPPEIIKSFLVRFDESRIGHPQKVLGVEFFRLRDGSRGKRVHHDIDRLLGLADRFDNGIGTAAVGGKKYLGFRKGGAGEGKY